MWPHSSYAPKISLRKQVAADVRSIFNSQEAIVISRRIEKVGGELISLSENIDTSIASGNKLIGT